MGKKVEQDLYGTLDGNLDPTQAMIPDFMGREHL
jgi:hypothetical protein